ncbi:MAG: pyridoxal phosphate-dependent aminotransferase [Myxococcales bacterium]|nr:pyridoxal phosphate-dependent aminotransferase [Myxococcales bacterium]
MQPNLKTSSRLDPIKPSITLAVTAKAAKLKAAGVDVISFGAGEPDFDTPEHIKQAARVGLDKGVGKYTDVAGLVALREAVAKELSSVHGVELTAANIEVSTGAKHSLYNVFMALLDPGDEVLIPAPYWVSYPDMVTLAGGVPVIVPSTAADDFVVSAAAIEKAITPRTRMLVINTPNNPSGAVIGAAQMAAIAEVVVRHNLLVVSDDIYRSLVYGDAQYVSIARQSPEAAARTILVDGLSKAYAMTGWRIGYTAAPVSVIAAMNKLQGQSTSNPTHIAQVAAIAALTGPQACVETMRRAFDERRLEMVKLLRAIPEVACREPKGAFYAFPDVSAYLGRKTPEGRVLADDVALCDWLVETGHVAIVPGSGFGAPGHVRLSYACSIEQIRAGIARLASHLATLTKVA